MLSDNDKSTIVISADVTVEKMKPVHGGCLYYSSMYSALVGDHTNLKPRLVIGSLIVSGETVFRHTPLKNLLDSGSDIISQWDGHAWVEISDFVCDLSIFQTIYSAQTPKKIKGIFEDLFSPDKKYIIGQKSKLEGIDMFYTPEEVLEDKHINLLINSAHKIGLIGS